MKILVVSPFLPYPGVPHAGGKFVYFLLQTLLEHHSVSLVSRYFPGEERHFEMLRKMLSGLDFVPVSGPVKTGSLQSLWGTVRSYYRLCHRAREAMERERFDVCQVEFTETGVFWTPPSDVPSVLTCHDILAKPAFRRYEASGGISKVLHWFVWKTKQEIEKYSLSKFARVFTLSEVDREWAERLYPGVSIRVLRYPGGLGFAGLARKEVPGRILFLGALNRPQNIESVRYFREKVWPAVRERVPDAEFRVAGGGLPRDLEREMSEDPRVVVTGFVENIEEEYKSASVFVAPILTGGGVIVKILDALAAGVPVVTTTFGNEGIVAKPGEEILVSRDPDQFLRNVLALLEDREYRVAMGDAGRRFVELTCGAGRFAEMLGKTYRELDGSPVARETYSDSTSRT
jgi:glycosyltransferase involved in cell wall biosynthesis